MVLKGKDRRLWRFFLSVFVADFSSSILYIARSLGSKQGTLAEKLLRKFCDSFVTFNE